MTKPHFNDGTVIEGSDEQADRDKNSEPTGRSVETSNVVVILGEGPWDGLSILKTGHYTDQDVVEQTEEFSCSVGAILTNTEGEELAEASDSACLFYRREKRPYYSRIA